MANSEEKLLIPIGDSDIESFEKLIAGRKNNITWSFETNHGKEVHCIFVREEFCNDCGGLSEPIFVEDDRSCNIIHHWRGCKHGKD